ncbi:MAG: flippase-like domain-containing protein [Gemmatimonas sp.]|nr:flippase-like domain-containing protein [Gemmatimonas sp.]
MTRRFRTTFGILLSVFLLWWALRDVSFEEVVEQIRQADPFLFTISIAITIGGFWFRAVRWGVLLLPATGPVPMRPRMAATFIGFAANNLLPARVGEFARAFSLSRLSTVPISSAFATLVVERILDGIVLVGLLLAAMASRGFPSTAGMGTIDLRTAAMSLATFITLLGLTLGAAVAFPSAAARIARATTRLLPQPLRVPVYEALRGFARGLVVLRSPRLFAVSVLLAIGQWSFLAFSFLFAFRAFRIEGVPFAGAAFLQSLISLAVAVPSSPGFFGPFEAAARLGLSLWGVPANQAISFAIGFHIGGFLPVTIIGGYYVWRLNLRWTDVRHSEETVEEDLPSKPGTATAAPSQP